MAILSTVDVQVRFAADVALSLDFLMVLIAMGSVVATVPRPGRSARRGAPVSAH